jgi:ParB/RepB/Spo0J family partition protein
MRVGEVSESLVDSIRQNGLLQPIIVSKDGSGRVSLVAGMHRLLAIKKLGWKEVSVCVTDRDPRIVEIDENLVRKELTVLEKAEQIVLKKTLYEGKGFAVETAKLMNATPRLVFMYVQIGSAPQEMRDRFRAMGMNDDLRKMLDMLRRGVTAPGNLSKRFGFPPFSVLNARDGAWQDRKNEWKSLGIRSEVGRGSNMLDMSAAMAGVTDEEEKKLWNEARRSGKAFGTEGNISEQNATSIFDPVLCELMYNWFCPPKGLVLDPFAGGSVRGVVAAKMGFPYVGVDLRPEQVSANIAQWKELDTTPAKPLGSNTPEITPVEKHGNIWFKRDDLFSIAGVAGGKVRTCWGLAQGAKGLVTAGSRASPQVNIVAHIAERLGIPCRVHTPTGEASPEVQAAIDVGAERVTHNPGYNTVIVARAHADAQARGWKEIPFGMECEEAITATRAQVANIPKTVSRIVIPVGSGMSLAGVLWGLLDAKRSTPVLGVIVGADPTARLDKWAPPNWREMVTLVSSGVDYHAETHATISGSSIVLDPVYEAKCVSFLKDSDCLWCVGVRQTATSTHEDATKTAKPQFDKDEQVWRISAAWANKPLNCTVEGITKPGGCGGRCCRSESFWPPKSGTTKGHGCDLLGPQGCTLPPEDKPVVCHLYPLRLNPAQTLVCHHRAPTGCCKPNWGHGPAIIDVVSDSLATLFGTEERDRIVAEIKGGRDTTVSVPQDISTALAIETRWEEANTKPQPRRQAVAEERSRHHPSADITPRWIVGDSRDIPALCKLQADMIFSCPPYADLEVYSDDPRDISTMDYPKFREAYRDIIQKSCALLKDNRFAVFVVGEVRSPGGPYRNFVGDTVQAFLDAGLKFYNEAILVTPVGSLPMRASKQFTSSRKFGKTHQNILVFVKGDPWAAAKAVQASPLPVSHSSGSLKLRAFMKRTP